MMSGITTQSIPVMQQMSGSQMPPSSTEATQNAGAVEGVKEKGDRPPPPPPPPEGGASGSQGGGQMGGADPAALLQSLFETADAYETEESTEEASLLETLTAMAAEGYESAQSIFGG